MLHTPYRGAEGLYLISYGSGTRRVHVDCGVVQGPGQSRTMKIDQTALHGNFRYRGLRNVPHY